MEALDGHMMLGRDFAAITAFKATGHSLANAGCTHLSALEIKESSYYWRTPAEAKTLVKRLFDEYWHAGGNEMAIMQGRVAMARYRDWHFRPCLLFLLCLFGLARNAANVFAFVPEYQGEESYKGDGAAFLEERRRQEVVKAAADGDGTSPAASPSSAAKSSAAGAAQSKHRR